MKNKAYVILSSLLLGSFIWCAEAIVEYFFFFDLPLADLLIFNIPKYSIYVRITLFLYFAALGMILGLNSIKKKNFKKVINSEHKKLQAIIESIPAYVYLLSSDYSILFFNDKFRKLFGNPSGKKCFQVFRHRDTPCPNCISHQIFKTNKSVQREWTAINGKTYMAHSVRMPHLDGVDMVLKLGVDITEHKYAEMALKESEDRFHQLFEKAPLGYQSLDFNANIIEVNETWLDILGYTRDEVIGKWFGHFLHPEHHEQFKNCFEIFKSRGKITDLEFKIVKKDGYLLICSLTCRRYYCIMAYEK